MTAIPKITRRFETSLASALSAGGSSFTLESATDEDGNALSGLYGCTIDVGSADVEDFVVSISGTTATITYRGIDADDPVTEVAANKKAHRRGASVVITDFPILAYLRNLMNGESGYTFPNKLSYASHPTFSSDTELVDKKYVDDTNNTGAANAGTTTAGLVEEATQAEVDARTTTGGTGAKLFAPLDKIRASLYHDYAADAGANDTYAVTITPAPTAYTTGMVVEFKANTANTGACTLNVNSLGAKSLKVNKDLDPQDGYIKAGSIVLAVYDGTNFQIQSASGKPSVSQSGEETYAASSSGNDTYAITLAPVPAAYVTGMVLRFKADVGNTGTATLNVNSLGAKTLVKGVSDTLDTGDIAAGQFVTCIYDGTNFVVTSPLGNTPRVLSRDPTTNSTSSTTEKTMATFSVPGGLLSTYRAIRIKMPIRSTLSGNAYAFDVKLKFGSTTLMTCTVNGQNASNTDVAGMIEAVLYANGATNAQYGSLAVVVGEQGTGGSMVGGGSNGTGTAAEDSTATKTISVTVTSGNASYTQTCYGSIIELL